MATTSTLIRGKRRISCKHCGQGDLEWVKLTDVKSVTGAWDAKSPKTTGWKYVPFGTEDFSGKVHSLRPDTCGKAEVQGGVTETPDNAVPDMADAVEQAIPAAKSTLTDALIDARLTVVEQNLDLVRQTVNDQAKGINDLGAAVRVRLDNVDEAIARVATADTSKLDAKIASLAKDVAALSAARPIEISVNAMPAVNVGRQHYMFANLVAIAAAVGDSGIPFLVGERGSGKSHVAIPLAKALGYNVDTELEMYECNTDTSATDVFGYHNANGAYVETGWYRGYTAGKLMFADELPRAMPDALAAFNSITSGTVAGWPNGVQKRHPRNLVVAAGNTSGRGASDDYEGNKLDAATLSRLVYIPWDTDWALVGDLHGFKIDGFPQPFPDPGAPRKPAEYADWGKFVKRIADMLPDLGITASVSARSVINGAKLLAAGIDRGLVEYATIWGHMSEQDAATVKAAL